MKRALLLVLLLALVPDAAWADYQVRGRFMYRDRAFTLSGFTGFNDPDLPIRFADVQVVDANSQSVLASGSTDAAGFFTIQVSETQTRNVQVRVLSTSNDAGVPFRVLEEGSGAIFAVATSPFSSHPPTQDIDFSSSPVIAVQFGGGEAFNIFDQTLDAMDLIKDLKGSYPNASSQNLTLYWRRFSDNGTFYNPASRSIFLFGLTSDSDGYDDCVIVHEIGHYVEAVFGDTDNPGLNHTVSGCFPQLNLTWSEGFATAFQNMVRDWQGLARPDIYVDTFGQPGPGQAFISYDVERPSAGVPGSGNEVSVTAALWDILDDATTADGSPGVDDDDLQVPDAATRLWAIETQYLPQPSVSVISIEDFWEGWFALGYGLTSEMAANFESHGMRFAEDAHETDDSAAQARDGGTLTQATQHSISGDGDQDWTRFDGIAGSDYVFRTMNLTCGSDTRLDLYDSDGTTLLASNVNDPFNPPASRIDWTASKNGDLFLRVTRPAGSHEYATYDLFVDIQVPVLVSDVRLTGDSLSVEITWRTDQDAGFAYFHLDRSPQRDGPWTRANPVPIEPLPGDANAFRFVDIGIQPGEVRYYQIVGVDTGGQEAYFGPHEIRGSGTPPPARVVFYAPRPNPLYAGSAPQKTLLRFDLPSSSHVSLRVYNVGGRLVRNLIPGETMSAGPGLEAEWDGVDDDGRPVASGVYFVVLEALGSRHTQRAVVMVR